VAPGATASISRRRSPRPSRCSTGSGRADTARRRTPRAAEDKPRTAWDSTWSGNSRSGPHVANGMPTDVTLRTVHMPDIAWTFMVVTCDAVEMTVTDPLLVVRRHVDLLRVRSAICRDAR
jgi:hypothetical protein